MPLSNFSLTLSGFENVWPATAKWQSHHDNTQSNQAETVFKRQSKWLKSKSGKTLHFFPFLITGLLSGTLKSSTMNLVSSIFGGEND